VTERLLTARDLGEYLGLSPATVLRRWRAGEIPGFRLASNVVRFDRREVDVWLEARRNGPGVGGGTTRPTTVPTRGVVSPLPPVRTEEDCHAR
jgi:excisionase family DNA binding protein